MGSDEDESSNVRSPCKVSNNVWISIERHTRGAIMTVVRSNRGETMLGRVS